MNDVLLAPQERMTMMQTAVDGATLLQQQRAEGHLVSAAPCHEDSCTPERTTHNFYVIRSGTRSQCKSFRKGVTWSYLHESDVRRAAALMTDCSRSRSHFGKHCIVAKQFIVQQKCLKKWIESVILGTRWYNFQPFTQTLNARVHSVTDKQTDYIIIRSYCVQYTIG